MSTGTLLILGALAGATIVLGMPFGRLSRPLPRTRALLNAIACGILVFLLFDVLAHANEFVEGSLVAATDSDGSWLTFVVDVLLFGGGLAVGALSLVVYDRWLARRSTKPVSLSAAATSAPPRTAHGPLAVLTGRSEAYRLAVFIALGIGLHNFSEGLAIGQSAAQGEISLAIALIVGFALHNGTEGFGIIGPFAAADERPSWATLGMLALIGGGPTFVGTLLGQSFVNDALALAFLALAAGSILYVVVQLLKTAQKLGHPQLLMGGLVIGTLLGFGTDWILVAVGA
jgi:zinc transporter, ZIP family